MGMIEIQIYTPGLIYNEWGIVIIIYYLIQFDQALYCFITSHASIHTKYKSKKHKVVLQIQRESDTDLNLKAPNKGI